MVTGKQVFTFVDKQVGVTQNGEKYLAINVLTKGNVKSRAIGRLSIICRLKNQQFLTQNLIFKRLVKGDKKKIK